MRKNKLNYAITTLTVLLAFGVSSWAAVISYVKVTNDADSGISSDNIYTHAIDFQQSGAGATVNGVAFTSLGGDGAGFTRTATTPLNHNGAGVSSTTGNLANLMQGFLFDGTTGISTQTYTLSGLTAGTTYDLRIYTHAWGSGANRPNTLVFDVGGANDSTGVINEDNATSVGMPDQDDSYYISYRYVAPGSSLVFTATSSIPNASWHLYGLSNQVVPAPEPSTLGLIGLSAGLLYNRRRNLLLS